MFQLKEAQVNVTNPNLYVTPFPCTTQARSVSNHHNHPHHDDSSEPIYTDPSLFERSRSMRSVTVSTLGQQSQSQTKSTPFD